MQTLIFPISKFVTKVSKIRYSTTFSNIETDDTKNPRSLSPSRDAVPFPLRVKSLSISQTICKKNPAPERTAAEKLKNHRHHSSINYSVCYCCAEAVGLFSRPGQHNPRPHDGGAGWFWRGYALAPLRVVEGTEK